MSSAESSIADTPDNSFRLVLEDSNNDNEDKHSEALDKNTVHDDSKETNSGSNTENKSNADEDSSEISSQQDMFSSQQIFVPNTPPRGSKSSQELESQPLFFAETPCHEIESTQGLDSQHSFVESTPPLQPEGSSPKSGGQHTSEEACSGYIEQSSVASMESEGIEQELLDIHESSDANLDLAKTMKPNDQQGPSKPSPRSLSLKKKIPDDTSSPIKRQLLMKDATSTKTPKHQDSLDLTPTRKDVGVFGSMMGIVDHGTPKTETARIILGSKRKNSRSSESPLSTPAHRDISSDSDVECLEEKRPRQSLEVVYQSTTNSMRKIAPDSTLVKIIEEEDDSINEMEPLRLSPTQDTSTADLGCLPRVMMTLTREKVKTPPSELENENSNGSPDSNSIFSKVDMLKPQGNSKGKVPLSESAVGIVEKLKQGAVPDTLPAEGSDYDASPRSMSKKNDHEETKDKTPHIVTETEAKDPIMKRKLILVEVQYKESKEGQGLEEVAINWALAVTLNKNLDSSHSMSKSSSSPQSVSSDIKTPFQLPGPRVSILSTSSGSSGSSALNLISKIPQKTFHALDKSIVLSKDTTFCADRLLAIVPQCNQECQTEESEVQPIKMEKASEELELIVNTLSEKVPAKKSVAGKVLDEVKASKKASSAKKSKAVFPRGKKKTMEKDEMKTLETVDNQEISQTSTSTPRKRESQNSQSDRPTRSSTKLQELSQENTSFVESDRKLQKGKLIFAKWADDLYYPGTIQSSKEGRWVVKFDDDAIGVIQQEKIIAIEKLDVGQLICANPNQGSFYYGGIITSRRDEPGTPDGMLYSVELSEVGKCDVKRSQISLTEEQVKFLGEMAPETLNLMTPPRCTDVSLDNIMDGKRSRSSKRMLPMADSPSRRGRSKQMSENQPSCSNLASGSRVTRQAELNLTQSSDSAADETKSWSNDWSILPDVEPEVWPVSLWGDLRKRKNKSQAAKLAAEKEAKLGPLPKQKIFDGYFFMLTHVENAVETESQSEMDSEYESQDTNVTPCMDRKHIEQQLAAGGGNIVTCFEAHQVRYSPKKCIILANRCNWTAKTVLGLAMGVPCVKYTWVIHCCREGAFIDPNSFALPAGKSTLDKSLKEWTSRHKQPRMFCQRGVAVVSDLGTDYLDFWSRVLRDARCPTVCTFTTAQFNALGKMDVCPLTEVMTDCDCPPELKAKAKELGVSMVTSNWVVQSLVHAKCLPVDKFLF